jgi:hypothetical protein
MRAFPPKGVSQGRFHTSREAKLAAGNGQIISNERAGTDLDHQAFAHRELPHDELVVAVSLPLFQCALANALRIAESGASRPCQISNARAPWCSSMDAPFDPRAPIVLAASSNGVR